ncbi:MAG TPA: hypothetical protein VI381_01360 [Allosphingosinicella sp.]
MNRILPLILLLCAACSNEDGGNTVQDNAALAPGASVAADDGAVDNLQSPLNPPAPGEPGGLPDDRTPVSEAPFTQDSAQGAANVVQTYYALLEQGKYREAWRLWSEGGEASGMGAEAFTASFAEYAEYHANIGAPGRIEGAAGSLYVTVPVQLYGRLKSGEPFNRKGAVTLRRVNDVPGSTGEQRRWHIASTDVEPRP